MHDSDSGDHVARLVQSTTLAVNTATQDADHRPVLQGSNGASFKATRVLASLNWLGIKPSPRVCDDHAFVEPLSALQVSAGVPGNGLYWPGCRTPMDEQLSRLIQRAAAQQHRLRDAGAAPRGPGPAVAGSPASDLSAAPGALGTIDEELDNRDSSHPNPEKERKVTSAVALSIQTKYT